ncbi:MAG: glycerophosphodiester phosphodiesterase [Desulfuromonadaceae bacterium]|nr:glycerophosphodiester phosphodiesterase [Desulfuromonadaceae bacterium]MDD5104481.1 glycerophosphodiester phosphodiesterase [Desulfuromonadaceae bacterium]
MSIEPLRSLPLIIAHRGASRDAPENTLASFRLAWEQGADGIEADFRLTSDGEIVCMHDASTGRTTGVDRNIADSTMKELRILDAGRWKGPAWPGAAIPTLDEVLSAAPAGSWLFIEVKCGVEIIEPLARVLRTSGRSPERIRLLSFNAALIAELKRRLPDWRTAWSCDYRFFRRSTLWVPNQTEVLAILRRIGADGLASANRSCLDVPCVEDLIRHDKELHVWTVDQLRSAQRLSKMGVDSIITNRPGWLRQKLIAGGVP